MHGSKALVDREIMVNTHTHTHTHTHCVRTCSVERCWQCESKNSGPTYSGGQAEDASSRTHTQTHASYMLCRYVTVFAYSG